MRTRETIESQGSVRTAKDQPSKANKAARIAKWQWKPGESGNPGGRPKQDMSQIIARAIFEQNPELIYKAYGRLLSKGSAFGFQVVAERAFGKLKETRDTGSEFNEVPDADLQSRLDAILRDLGITQQIDACGRSEVNPGGTPKANGAAKDPDLLPR
jgi:hypothetical protein